MKENQKREVYIFSDSHIYEWEGKFWCDNAIYAYDFWTRYLYVFDGVKIVSRVKRLEKGHTKKLNRVDGERVSVIPMPFLRGTKDYLLRFGKLKRALARGTVDMEYAILRLPSVLSFFALSSVRRKKCPYALEIVADPLDCYGGNGAATKLFYNMMRRACRKAPGVSYVTRDFLQSRYPSGGEGHFTGYYSSIDLDDDFFYQPRIYPQGQENDFTIIHIANSIHTDIKGHSTLLKVVEGLVKKGYSLKCICIGGGERLKYYKEMANSLGIGGNVVFTGLLSSKEEIRKYLLKSDLMVFPSQAEGLPRVLIEAMATGLPCISTPVNGIPELLEEKYLFAPFDVEGFGDCVERLIQNPEELGEMSRANFEKAKDYRREKLQQRRNLFYGRLLELGK